MHPLAPKYTFVWECGVRAEAATPWGGSRLFLILDITYNIFLPFARLPQLIIFIIIKTISKDLGL